MRSPGRPGLYAAVKGLSTVRMTRAKRHGPKIASDRKDRSKARSHAAGAKHGHPSYRAQSPLIRKLSEQGRDQHTIQGSSVDLCLDCFAEFIPDLTGAVTTRLSLKQQWALEIAFRFLLRRENARSPAYSMPARSRQN